MNLQICLTPSTNSQNSRPLIDETGKTGDETGMKPLARSNSNQPHHELPQKYGHIRDLVGKEAAGGSREPKEFAGDHRP